MKAHKTDFLTVNDFDSCALEETIDNAIKMKSNYSCYKDVLKDKTLAMLFMKTSTRTRISFEAGISKLGGHAIFLDYDKTNFTLGSLADETKCVSRYVDLIMTRVFGHEQIKAIAKASEVPVINGLSDLHHPCQALADLMTIKEKKGFLDGLKIAFVGDGNNVCNSLIQACEKLGLDISVACPEGFEPAEKSKALDVLHDPSVAVAGADVVYTDTWVSLGFEAEKEKRLKAFEKFQVNSRLLKLAKQNALFMHCLPVHRGFEVTDDVIDSKQSIVFDQAENRMHAQNALMLKLSGVM